MGEKSSYVYFGSMRSTASSYASRSNGCLLGYPFELHAASSFPPSFPHALSSLRFLPRQNRPIDTRSTVLWSQITVVAEESVQNWWRASCNVKQPMILEDHATCKYHLLQPCVPSLYRIVAGYLQGRSTRKDRVLLVGT